MGHLKIVLLLVGAMVLLALAGIIGLSAFDRGVPETLPTVAVGGLTAMVGLLVPSKSANSSDSDSDGEVS